MSTLLIAQSKVDIPATKADFKKLEAEAKGGDAPAQYELAQCYRRGIPGVVSMNGTTANKWIKKAADNGHPDACVEVYNWDKQKYIAYAERAKKVLLEIGTGDAYLSMAKLYIYGGDDYLKWLNAAYKNGSKEAKERLIAIYKHKTTSDDLATWVSRIPMPDIENLNTQGDIADIDMDETSGHSGTKSDIAGRSFNNDVDIYAPLNQQNNNNTFALIIGNEHYAKLPDVPYALNDARVFRTYCEKTLGLPESNIIFVTDATAATMNESIEDLRMNVARKKGEASVIFYYAGHGMPDNKTGKGYMIPQDVSRLNQKMCLSISDAMDEMANMDVKGVVCFLDACFSGVKRDGDLLASSDGTRALKRNVELEVPKGKIVIFSATKNDETAWPLKDKGHGVFTYFLLKKLKEDKGNMTLGKLADYLMENVTATTYNTRSFTNQTPTIVASPNIVSSWRDLKLR